MVQLRKDNLVLVYGQYTLLDKNNKHDYAYTRELNNNKLLVLLNFSAQNAKVNTGTDMNYAKVLINNYTSINTSNLLRPYEAVVYELK
jgi:oligo-1,6-glucosidase